MASHRFEVVATGPETATLRHVLEMTTTGSAWLSWPVIYRPLHDALLEDALATAQASLGYPPTVKPWSLWVKILRWLLSLGRAGPQVILGEPIQRVSR